MNVLDFRDIWISYGKRMFIKKLDIGIFLGFLVEGMEIIIVLVFRFIRKDVSLI